LIRLEASEPAELEEFAGQVSGVRTTAFQRAGNLVQLGRLQDVVFAKGINQIGSSGNGHGNSAKLFTVSNW